MKRYAVSFTFGATIIVEADSLEEAERIVEEDKSDEELLELADGFCIQDVEEVPD